MEGILGFKLLDIENYPISVLLILEIMLVIEGAKAFIWLLTGGLKRTSKIYWRATYSITQLIS